VNPRSLPADVAERVLGKPIEREYSLMDLLKRPGVSYASLSGLELAGVPVADAAVAEQVEIQAKYQGYVARQHEEIARHERYETLALPRDLDYYSVRGLSIEVQQKLNQHRPGTVGQASRISGVTPAAITLLLVHLKRGMSRAERSAA
jgi:tRNA uridine 5-carboxymethylaminomethyl modification enzyme